MIIWPREHGRREKSKEIWCCHGQRTDSWTLKYFIIIFVVHAFHVLTAAYSYLFVVKQVKPHDPSDAAGLCLDLNPTSTIANANDSKTSQ